MRMPGAEWIGPTGNRGPAQMSTVIGVVLHIQQGHEAGTEAWQRNPLSQISSHFLAPLAGGIRQMVDTSDKAWCEVEGNSHWLSVECEGFSGGLLTPLQVDACARILLWAHQMYAVPLASCDNPAARWPAEGGLGWHGMGGAAWGGHLNCPGAPIVSQRGLIVRRAFQLGAVVTEYLSQTEQKELADVDFTTTEIPLPDGTRTVLHQAMAELIVTTRDLKARPAAPTAADVAAALLAQGLTPAAVAQGMYDLLKAPRTPRGTQ